MNTDIRDVVLDIKRALRDVMLDINQGCVPDDNRRRRVLDNLESVLDTIEQSGNRGKWAKDTVTGFSGVITGYATYLTGCGQYSILPGYEGKGSYPTACWIDETRIEIDESVKRIVIEGENNDKGCDTPAPVDTRGR